MVRYRVATQNDAPILARLNQALIRDEGHRNTMTLHELEQRMAAWLDEAYHAVVFEDGDQVIGYALFRYETDYVHLRQLYVIPGRRREGIGKAAMSWLRAHEWRDRPRVRIDVLAGNETAIAFWRAIGFQDYCLTMEMGEE